MLKKIVLTEDGSHSLKMGDTDEHYHSIHGARQESEHIFINAGLKYLGQKDKINIFEVGFGTGLNAYLTYCETIKSSININFISIEAYPIEKELYSELNYNQYCESDTGGQIFQRMHDSAWNQKIVISDCFELTKIHDKLQNFQHYEKYHLVYFDAFGPDFQPDMWSEDIFSSLYKAMYDDGILVTYCAKGIVRRMMKSAGFFVEKIPGPPGKREITRAIKQ